METGHAAPDLNSPPMPDRLCIRRFAPCVARRAVHGVDMAIPERRLCRVGFSAILVAACGFVAVGAYDEVTVIGVVIFLILTPCVLWFVTA
jgi:hypothetical protein